MRLTAWLLLALTASCLPVGGGKQAARNVAKTDSKGRSVQVTLNIFSGRENPTWRLSEEQGEELIAVLDSLPISGPSDPHDGLGYRGFSVIMSGSASEEPVTVTAYKGRIRYVNGGRIKHLADEERRVEKLLLQSGGSHLNPSIFDVVRKEVEPPKQ